MFLLLSIADSKQNLGNHCKKRLLAMPVLLWWTEKGTQDQPQKSLKAFFHYVTTEGIFSRPRRNRKYKLTVAGTFEEISSHYVLAA
jgi:hypothetical protein